METVRYVHAADLHLDAPFAGLSQNGAPGLAQALKDASFQALENLATLCETERPDFLLLAGDIYNQEERSIRAQLRVRDLCVRLQKLGIRVFICHGNHDPLSSSLASISWPDNVTIFGPEPTFASVSKNGETLALVHGVSHADGRESRNLAQMIQRDPTQDCFQIGLLHCNVDGAVASDRYAPCSLADLRDAGLDAWALGHAHERRELSEAPFIAYSGAIQGLRANETGPKGCYLVDYRYSGSQWQCEARFVALAPILWQKADVDISDIAAINDLVESLAQTMQEAADAAQNRKGVILSLRLTGRAPLDAELRKPSALEDIKIQLESFASASPAVWIRNLELATSPASEPVDNLDRDDLPGEIARVAKNMGENRDELGAFAKNALGSLYGNRRYSQFLSPPDGADLEEMLQAAQRICLDVLEGR